MTPNSAVHVLIVEPDPMGPAERFATWFHAAGAVVRTIRPYLGDAVPEQARADAVLVMGGQMNARADHQYPWLGDIRRLFQKSVDTGLPVLGVCLGAQLLATAFGGEVEVSSERGPERGLVEVEWTEHAATDAITAGLPSPFTACASHSDGISELPAEAVLLGTGRTYPHQIFRIGTAVGVQFHPETTPGRFRQWCQHESQYNGPDQDLLTAKIREFEERDSDIEKSTRILADRFLASARVDAQPL